MELIKNLQWRYAVKKYSKELVNEDKIDQIIEVVNLTVLSCGIQPYCLFVITNPEVRQRLGHGSFNIQIHASSHYWYLPGLIESLMITSHIMLR